MTNINSKNKTTHRLVVDIDLIFNGVTAQERAAAMLRFFSRFDHKKTASRGEALLFCLRYNATLESASSEQEREAYHSYIVSEMEDVKKKRAVLDLSSQPENLDITAEQFSAIVNKPDLPKEFQTILDTYCEVKQ